MYQIEESQRDEQNNKSNKGKERVEVKDSGYKARNDRGENNSSRRIETFTHLNTTRENIMNVLL